MSVHMQPHTANLSQSQSDGKASRQALAMERVFLLYDVSLIRSTITKRASVGTAAAAQYVEMRAVQTLSDATTC